MAAEFGHGELCGAIMARWDQKGMDSVISGGLYAEEQTESVARPYAFLGSLGEVPTLMTNKSKYADLGFTIELVTANLEVGAAQVGAIKDCVSEADIAATTAMNHVAILHVIPGKVTYVTEVTYLRVILEFTAKISQARTIRT